MGVRLYRLIATLLLVILPWQGIAGASMVSCAHAAATSESGASDVGHAHAAAGTPCHETPTPDGQGAHEALPDLGGWNACSGCAQCHACCAGVLPMVAQDTLVFSPSHPVFIPPAAIAGVVLEHLDPPPVG